MLAAQKEAIIMFAEMESWILRLMGSARNGIADGPMEKALVGTDSLVMAFVRQHRCESQNDLLLREWRAKHPSQSDYVLLPSHAVPPGALIL
jgi:hypothetical protein